MPSLPPDSQSGSRASGRRATGAWLFALAGLVALGVSGFLGWQRYRRENPPPLPGVIAPIPPEMREGVRTGMQLLGKTLLQLTPEQNRKLAEIWKTSPRSINEAIEYQKETDKLLDARQKAIMKPIRKTFQDRVVDHMMEHARDRFSEADFGKLKDEIKVRVEKRITGE